MRRQGEAGGEEETLHGVLVHAGGGAEDARADVGDVGELEEALDRAVFAEGAVQDGEDDVDAKGGGGLKLAAGGVGEAFGFRLGIGAGEQGLALSACSQRPCLVMPISDDVVLFSVDEFEDGVCGAERDLVLAALAAKENAYAELLFHVFL